MGMTNSFHTSTKGHAIGGAGKLASVQRHNDRGYFSFEYDSNKIHNLIGDSGKIVADVQTYINTKFQAAIDEYNEKQPRKDRLIEKTPYQYFCDNKKLDIANEAVFQIGDKDFWAATRRERRIERNGKKYTLKDQPDRVKDIMDDIFMKQAQAYENIYETHGDEITKRIRQEYERSCRTMEGIDVSERMRFSILADMKEKEREPELKTFSDEELERFGLFMQAKTAIDFIDEKRLIERIESGAMTIKMINLTAHYDEWSPHAHGVSVCSVRGYESGLNERVAKSVVLNKYTLSVLQDVLHKVAEQEMAKHPELFSVELEEKQEGRQYYEVSAYKAMKEKEKLKELQADVQMYSGMAKSEMERAERARAEADAAREEAAKVVKAEQLRADEAAAAAQRQIDEALRNVESVFRNKEEYDAEMKRFDETFTNPQSMFQRRLKAVWKAINEGDREEIKDAFKEFLKPIRYLWKLFAQALGFEMKTNMPEKERRSPDVAATINDVLSLEEKLTDASARSKLTENGNVEQKQKIQELV